MCCFGILHRDRKVGDRKSLDAERAHGKPAVLSNRLDAYIYILNSIVLICVSLTITTVETQNELYERNLTGLTMPLFKSISVVHLSKQVFCEYVYVSHTD